jgi:hypothetical protein
MPRPPEPQKPFTGYRLEAAGESARSVPAVLSATHPRLQVLATSSRSVAVAEAEAAMLYDAIDAMRAKPPRRFPCGSVPTAAHAAGRCRSRPSP